MIAVAIDGPAGAGKSTIAKILAKKVNFIYMDTGALYRTITLSVLRNKISDVCLWEPADAGSFRISIYL